MSLAAPLDVRLNSLRRRVRQLVWVYGLSWVAMVLFGATLAVGFLDWLIHLDDPGVRLILGLSIVAGAGGMAWRHLVRPLRLPLDDLELALQIERRYPGFRDSLASTVEFLEHRLDPRVGSPQLQQQVIAGTLKNVQGVRVEDIIETGSVQRITALAAGVCLLTALIVGVNQSSASIALRRLLFPFSAPAWPKSTDLRFVNAQLEPIEADPEEPLRIARGDTLELYVENHVGRLPERVRLEYWIEEGKPLLEPLRATTLRDDAGHSREVAAVRLSGVKGPIHFRAVGGDDHEMPWYLLEIVPPPTIEQLQVTLTPPEYTHRPQETLAPGVGHIEGLIGTQVRLEATAGKPLRSATLRWNERDPVALQLSPDRRQFVAQFEIDQPGASSYWLDLRDQQGFADRETPHYELRGIADLVPEIYIEQPVTDVQLTPDAELPIRTVAKDDLGLKGISLKYQTDANGPEQSLPLFDGADRPQQHASELTWKLSDLNLSQGARVTFHTEATDDYDLGSPHVGRSVVRTILIVSGEEKQQELAARVGNLLEDVQQVFDLQQRAHAQVEELQAQLEKAGGLRPQDLDLLKRVELDQRQIAAQLFNADDGLEHRADEIRAEFQSNQVAEPETERRLAQAAEELRRLRETQLPAIERELTQARKAADTETGRERTSDDATHQALSQVERHQTESLEGLDQILELLGEWRDRRDMSRDVNELLARQGELNRETAELGRDTLTKSPNELTAQEQADLARLAARQRKEADRVEQLRKKLDEVSRNLADSDPVTAETLAEARDDLTQQATEGRLREAASQLERNSIGSATQEQQTALEQLTELNNILRNRPGDDSETLVKKMRQAEQDLDELLRKQQDLQEQLEKLADATEQPEQLQQLLKQQQELRKEAAQLERRLRRLQAEQAGDAAGRAAERMRQAAEELQHPEQRQQAAAQQQEAMDDLQQSRRELARVRRQAEEQLAQEQLERLSDELKALMERQQTVIEETVRLDGEHQRRGNRSRGQLKSLRDLAEVEKSIAQATEHLTDKLSVAEVFVLALRGASRNLDQAGRRLADRDTGQETVDLEQAALQRFADLAAVLKRDPSVPPEEPPMEPDSDQPRRQGPPGESIPRLAQLKLLKTLQEDYLRRTRQLDELRRQNGMLTELQLEELAALADEQSQLADLTRNLMPAATRPAEVDEPPEKPNE